MEPFSWLLKSGMEPFYWLILLVVFLIIEIITLGLTTIWFAGGSLIAFVAAILHFPLLAQIAVFLLVSFMMLIFTRPVAERYFNAHREQTNVNGMIGKEAKVTVEIDNFNQTGTVLLNGVEWTARSMEDKSIIPSGSRVEICRVEGVKVFVKETENN